MESNADIILEMYAERTELTLRNDLNVIMTHNGHNMIYNNINVFLDVKLQNHAIHFCEASNTDRAKMPGPPAACVCRCRMMPLFHEK
jgi:hypothetical protein